MKLQNSLNDFLYERVSAVENGLVQATEYQTVRKSYNDRISKFEATLNPSQLDMFSAICDCHNTLNSMTNEACYLRGFQDVIRLVAGKNLEL